MLTCISFIFNVKCHPAIFSKCEEWSESETRSHNCISESFHSWWRRAFFFLLLLVHAIIRQRETRNIVIETSVTDGRLSYGWTNRWSANYLVDDAIVACVGGVTCSGTGRVRCGLLWLSGKGFQSRFGMSRGQSNHRDCSRACNNFKMCMRYVLKRHCSQFAYVALTVPRFLRWWW